MIDAWIVPELGVEPDATFAALDRSAWAGGAKWSVRVENYLVAVVRKELPHLYRHRALIRPLAPHIDLAAIPWRSRTRNALAAAGLLEDRHRLSGITYGDLLALPGIGFASVLDFAATAEIYVEEPPQGTVKELKEMTNKLLDHWWADQVTGDDPRFSDLLPHHQSVAETLELLQMTGQDSTSAAAEDARTQIPKLEQRVNDVLAKRLEESLTDYLCAALPGLGEMQTQALLARMGWHGRPPITLEAAGKIMGTTRERVRQLQARLYRRRPPLPLFMPALDRALDELHLAAPIPADKAAELLAAKGISNLPFHPASVLSAAEYCGKLASFELHELGGTEMVVSSRDLALAQRLTHIALRQAGRYGVSNLEEVLAQAAAEDLEASKEDLRTYLAASSRLQFLDEDWFWSPTIPNERNRLHNTTRGILSVISPMDIATLREGIWRRYQWRHLQLVAPRAILLEFYDAHPDFIVVGQYVQPAVPLDYRKELGPSEQVMVDVLRTVATGVLDRASFVDACVARGINPNTLSVMLTYSSVISHLETDAWALRGSDVSPMALKAVLDANAQRPRQRRMLDYGWTPDGQLWLAYRIPSAHSVVIGVPGPISRYVSGRSFKAVAEDGTPTGTVVIDNDSHASWGYGPFLSRRGADEGDVLRVTFDLLGATARLQLQGSEALDDDEASEPVVT